MEETRGLPGNRRAEIGAMVFAIVLPSLVTLLYFVVLDGFAPTVQQSAYSISKAVQFLFPLVWVLLVCREKLRWRLEIPGGKRPLAAMSGVSIGIAFGLAVLAAMLVLYHAWLKPFFDSGPADEVRAKVAGLEFDALWKYIALSTFYSLFHSFLEEYYWRWFVFGRLTRIASTGTAILVSSLGFMAHHVILLSVYFGAVSIATVLFSLAIAVGGAFWAWLYARTGSILGPWLSHLLIDAAIFLIGYSMVWRS